jgi:hypothetical protein
VGAGEGLGHQGLRLRVGGLLLQRDGQLADRLGPTAVVDEQPGQVQA